MWSWNTFFIIILHFTFINNQWCEFSLRFLKIWLVFQMKYISFYYFDLLRLWISMSKSIIKIQIAKTKAWLVLNRCQISLIIASNYFDSFWFKNFRFLSKVISWSNRSSFWRVNIFITNWNCIDLMNFSIIIFNFYWSSFWFIKLLNHFISIRLSSTKIFTATSTLL